MNYRWNKNDQALGKFESYKGSNVSIMTALPFLKSNNTKLTLIKIIVKDF